MSLGIGLKYDQKRSYLLKIQITKIYRSDIGENVFLFAGDVGAFDNKSEFFYDNISGVNFFATGMGGGKRDNFLLLHVNHGKVGIELMQL